MSQQDTIKLYMQTITIHIKNILNKDSTFLCNRLPEPSMKLEQHS